MKKLKLTEGWGPAPSSTVSDPNTNTVKNQIKSTLRTGGLPQSKPLTKAQQDALNAKNAITPDTGILDPRNDAAFVAPIKNPWMLTLLMDNPVAVAGGSAALLFLALKRRKFKKQQKLNLQAAAGVVNNPQTVGRLEKLLMKPNYQNYLIDRLNENGWFTEDEYNTLKLNIKNQKFRIKFRKPNEVRKEFKTFVIACMKHDRISIKDFRAYSELSNDEIERFMKSKLKFKYANNMRLTPDELAFEKYLEDISGGLNAKAIERKIKMNQPVSAAEKRALTLYNKNKASVISKFIR